MKEYCRPVDRAEYARTIPRILDTFRRIESGELPNDLSLLNYYKGIPIHYPASIIAIENEFVEYSIHPYQAVAIERDRSAFVKSAHLGMDLLAEAFYVKVSAREACLKNFLPTRVLAEERNFVRVALPEPASARVGFDRKEASGRLLDICQRSAALLLPPGASVRPGTACRLSLALPMGEGRSEALEVLATASIESPEPGGGVRLVVDLQCDHSTEARIARFIGHRQTEIVREIKEIFWAQEASEAERSRGTP